MNIDGNNTNPKISIITPCFNSKRYIEATIKSILQQEYSNIEYIIIDGGSTDGTIDIIKKYDKKIAYWISETDRSMYDAINKGLIKASGEIIGILNSDDILFDNKTISYIADSFNKHSNTVGIFGDLITFNEYNKKYRKVFKVSFKSLLISGKGTFLPHPTVYLRKEIYQFFFYDLKYKYAADYDFLLRILKKHQLTYINKPIVKFRVHEESITGKNLLKKEVRIILKKNKRNKINFIIRNTVYYWLWGKYALLNGVYRSVIKRSSTL